MLKINDLDGESISLDGEHERAEPSWSNDDAIRPENVFLLRSMVRSSGANVEGSAPATGRKRSVGSAVTRDREVREESLASASAGKGLERLSVSAHESLGASAATRGAVLGGGGVGEEGRREKHMKEREIGADRWVSRHLGEPIDKST